MLADCPASCLQRQTRVVLRHLPPRLRRLSCSSLFIALFVRTSVAGQTERTLRFKSPSSWHQTPSASAFCVSLFSSFNTVGFGLLCSFQHRRLRPSVFLCLPSFSTVGFGLPVSPCGLLSFFRRSGEGGAPIVWLLTTDRPGVNVVWASNGRCLVIFSSLSHCWSLVVGPQGATIPIL